MSLISRSFRRRSMRSKPLLLTFIIIFIIDACITTSSIPVEHRTTALAPSQKNEKIFIASINRNSEYMIRLFWSSALLALIDALGPQNVFVSILESGSFDDTKGALTDLQEQLNQMGVGNRIVLDIDASQQREEQADVPSEEQGRKNWIFTGRGEKGWEMRRIPYLANLRNRAMEPLREMEGQHRFDRVLWINDVVFTTEDVQTLLSTRGGEYAAACSLDFSKTSHIYYDTFALRDFEGLRTATLSYPYFYSSESLSALYRNAPVPVQSCWNGMVAFDAEPFYGISPLQFRGVEDALANEHVEGSECCLIHADNDSMRKKKGVWLNPNVRVTYNATTYAKVNPGTIIKADVTDEIFGVEVPGQKRGLWPGKWEVLIGVWRNRKARWIGSLRTWSETRTVSKAVRKWKQKGKAIGEEREEVGIECLINEMQVLYQSGWLHL